MYTSQIGIILLYIYVPDIICVAASGNKLILKSILFRYNYNNYFQSMGRSLTFNESATEIADDIQTYRSVNAQEDDGALSASPYMLKRVNF